MLSAKLVADRLDHGWAVNGAPDPITARTDLELEVLPRHRRSAGLLRAVDQGQLEGGAPLWGDALLTS